MSWHTDHWFLSFCSAPVSRPSARPLRRRHPTHRRVRQHRPRRHPRPPRRRRTPHPHRRNRRPRRAHPIPRRLRRPPPRAHRRRPPHRRLPPRRRPRQVRRSISSRRRAWRDTGRRPEMARRCTVRKPPISAPAFQRKSAWTNNRSGASWISNAKIRTASGSPGCAPGPAARATKVAPGCHPAPRRADPRSPMKSTAVGGL